MRKGSLLILYMNTCLSFNLFGKKDCAEQELEEPCPEVVPTDDCHYVTKKIKINFQVPSCSRINFTGKLKCDHGREMDNYSGEIIVDVPEVIVDSNPERTKKILKELEKCENETKKNCKKYILGGRVAQLPEVKCSSSSSVDPCSTTTTEADKNCKTENQEETKTCTEPSTSSSCIPIETKTTTTCQDNTKSSSSSCVCETRSTTSNCNNSTSQSLTTTSCGKAEPTPSCKKSCPDKKEEKKLYCGDKKEKQVASLIGNIDRDKIRRLVESEIKGKDKELSSSESLSCSEEKKKKPLPFDDLDKSMFEKQDGYYGTFESPKPNSPLPYPPIEMPIPTFPDQTDLDRPVKMPVPTFPDQPAQPNQPHQMPMPLQPPPPGFKPVNADVFQLPAIRPDNSDLAGQPNPQVPPMGPPYPPSEYPEKFPSSMKGGVKFLAHKQGMKGLKKAEKELNKLTK